MEVNRIYTTRRSAIVNALVAKLKTIDGTGSYRSNLYGNVSPRLKFWDEVTDFPSVHVSAGNESRVYHASNFKDRFLSVTIRAYVHHEDASLEIDKVLEDIETLLENNSRLAYVTAGNKTEHTQQISVISIDTDEGILEPIGVAEFLIQIQY